MVFETGDDEGKVNRALESNAVDSRWQVADVQETFRGDDLPEDETVKQIMGHDEQPPLDGDGAHSDRMIQTAFASIEQDRRRQSSGWFNNASLVDKHLSFEIQK